MWLARWESDYHQTKKQSKMFWYEFFGMFVVTCFVIAGPVIFMSLELEKVRREMIGKNNELLKTRKIRKGSCIQIESGTKLRAMNREPRIYCTNQSASDSDDDRGRDDRTPKEYDGYPVVLGQDVSVYNIDTVQISKSGRGYDVMSPDFQIDGVCGYYPSTNTVTLRKGTKITFSRDIDIPGVIKCLEADQTFTLEPHASVTVLSGAHIKHNGVSSVTTDSFTGNIA